MLDGLFNFLDRYSNTVPRFTAQRCLVVRRAVGGCDRCEQVCPHEAVTIEDGLAPTVEIDEKKCTACGLCVQVCPSGALEYDLLALLGAVKEQGDEAKLVCSQAAGVESGKAVPCLGRLTESVVVAAGGWDRELTLVHGDCASCSVGSPEVPERLAQVVERAQALREATGRPARVTVREADAAQSDQERVSRRGLFGAGLRAARGVAADFVPENPLPFLDWSDPKEHLPAEYLWRARALRPTPAPDAPVFWPAPEVDEKCILCPVCENVCPTDAIRREVQEDGSTQLLLNLAACTGCDACVKSCPPGAMHLRARWPAQALSATVLLRESDGTV